MGSWLARRQVKGKISIPNLSEEQSIDDISIEVTLDDEEKSDSAWRLKEAFRAAAPPEIRRKLQQYITELKEEYSCGLILPTKDGQTPAPKAAGDAPRPKPILADVRPSVKASSSAPLKSLRQVEKFHCKAEDLFRALTMPEMMRAWSKGPVESDVKPGGRLQLFNGIVQGEYVEVEPTKIVEKWRQRHWPAGHYSTVTLTLREIAADGETELTLVQTSIPDSVFDSVEAGWKGHYWNSIRDTFGFGAKLF